MNELPANNAAPANNVVPIKTTGSPPSVTSPDFNRFFKEHFAYVVHCLRRLGVVEADLDDVAQDVFVSVHRRFDDFDATRSARAWLFSFAARTSANYRRLARHRREVSMDGSDPKSEKTDPELSTYRTQQLAWIGSVLQQMGEDRRDALMMHDMDGLSAPEIATALEVPLNTVYSRVRRGREEFRKFAKATQKEES